MVFQNYNTVFDNRICEMKCVYLCISAKSKFIFSFKNRNWYCATTSSHWKLEILCSFKLSLSFLTRISVTSWPISTMNHHFDHVFFLIPHVFPCRPEQHVCLTLPNIKYTVVSHLFSRQIKLTLVLRSNFTKHIFWSLSNPPLDYQYWRSYNPKFTTTYSYGRPLSIDTRVSTNH